jgi:predicted nucleic acid-binding protein
LIIVLDTFPASNVAKPVSRHPTVSDQCRSWIETCERAGHMVLVPAIVYYESLRELEQRQPASQSVRLKRYCRLPDRFIPLTTEQIEMAARLWGIARRSGYPTAPDVALDADVILAAQVLSLGLESDDYIVATTNVGHLSRYVHCDLWTNITP